MSFKQSFGVLLPGVVLAVLLLAQSALAAPLKRIVSLDYCADQYVLKLADRAHILALSPDAQKPFSYLRAQAEGIPQVLPRLENILLLQPDLVVRSYGGGTDVSRWFQQADIAVAQIGWANDLPGIEKVVIEMAQALGQPARGEHLVADMQARLAAVQAKVEQDNAVTALYLTPTGVTSGSGTLIHAMLQAAGLRNYEQRPGWHSLPLEQLVQLEPDIVVGAFFGDTAAHQNAWSAIRHPVARRLLQRQPVVHVQSAWTACGGWFLLDAVETLAAQTVGSRGKP